MYLRIQVGSWCPSSTLEVLALLLVPVCTYVAILRYNLYDIGALVASRTPRLRRLTTCVVAIYVLAVVALGLLFQAQGNLAVSLAATGLVAVVFQPLRGRLQLASTASCTAKGRSVRGDLAPR